MGPVRLRGTSIEKRYGRVAALRGIDFEIAPGEAVALLGANGAGKSSLLKILAGLSKPSHGQFGAFVDGGTPPLDRSSLRAAVGYVGHATLLYGELSARENLDFAARLYGQRANQERIDQVLEDFALANVADRRADTFSRGMAQRLAIARAVIHRPGLLLLDEPFTGLDELSAERLSEQLGRLRSEERDAEANGGTPSLVVVTHDPRRATEPADRAILLHHGIIRATPSKQHAEEFTADALRSMLGEFAREASHAA